MTTIERLDLLDAVASVAPIVRENVEASEKMARLNEPVIAAMKEAGLFRGLAPRSLGGAEVDPLTFFKAVEAAARIDGSFGWNLFINGQSGMIGRGLADLEAEKLGSDPDAIVAASVFPFGKATTTDGGYVVNGRWTYASGISFATHVAGFAVIHDGDTPRMIAPEVPALASMLTTIDSVTILPTWDVNGLCATASNDFVMQDVFVPEAWATPLVGGRPNRFYTGPLYRMPFLTLFSYPMAAVALGIGQHAIDEALALATRKVPAGTAGTTLAQRPTFHLQLSEAQAAVASARAWLHELVAEQFELVQAGGSPDLAQRNACQLAASNATRSSARAVELMYLAGGGTANFRSSPLQRCLRDIHAVTQHVGTNPVSWETCGAISAGLPPQNPMLLL